MLRSFLKFGIKSSYVAYDKIKYTLGCLQEDIEDIVAEVKSEMQQEPPVYTQAQTQPEGTSQKNQSTKKEPQNIPTKSTDKAKEASLC